MRTPFRRGSGSGNPSSGGGYNGYNTPLLLSGIGIGLGRRGSGSVSGTQKRTPAEEEYEQVIRRAIADTTPNLSCRYCFLISLSTPSPALPLLGYIIQLGYAHKTRAGIMIHLCSSTRGACECAARVLSSFAGNLQIIERESVKCR